MSLHALLFGSIGTLADTSNQQRRAYNVAFAKAGLDWTWTPKEYRAMLRNPGGRQRIADYAAARGETVDVEAIHASKKAVFRKLVEAEGVRVKPGVPAIIAAAQERGLKLGFVTTTDRDQIDLVLNGLEGVPADVFDYVGERGAVAHDKPAPDIYLEALRVLGVAPGDALAIEDTPENAAAPLAAGIACVAFPGWDAAGLPFPQDCIEIDGRLRVSLLDRIGRDAA